MKRREFLLSSLAAAPKDKPPNIPILRSDEHHHRVAGCYGTAWRARRTWTVSPRAG
jgi:hypothetical protein